jgi:hypothetical protein
MRTPRRRAPGRLTGIAHAPCNKGNHIMPETGQKVNSLSTALMKRVDVSLEAKALFIFIARESQTGEHAPFCLLTNEGLAARSDIPKTSVSRCLAELKYVGAIWQMADTSTRVLGITKRPLRSRSYQTYLLSPGWRRRRKQALKRAGFRCQLCNSPDEHLEVHHRTYERVGDEKAKDLIVLCPKCHRVFHQNRRLARPNRG